MSERFFIQIKDGQPFEHRIYEDNFRVAFPEINVDSLPLTGNVTVADGRTFTNFILTQPPSGHPYIKNIDCNYVWSEGSIITEWPIEYFSPEEKLERQNIIKEAFANNVGFTSWLWNEEECRFDPPTPKPNDGHNYNWDEPTTSWVRVV